MKTTAKVRIGAEVKDIPLSQITLLFHDGAEDIEIVDPEVLVIDPQLTVDTARTIADEVWLEVRANPAFKHLFKLIWTERDPPVSLSGASASMLHTIGLILLLRHAQVHNMLSFVRWPETYLHPRNQAGLADVLAVLTKGASDDNE